MDTVYWVCLIVGGFFVALSIFGGDADADGHVDFDADGDVDFDGDLDGDVGHGDLGHGLGFVDLLTIRALFLFGMFFGLAGVLFTWNGTPEVLTATYATLAGLVAGLGGNYLLKRAAYDHISSNVTSDDLRGRTGRVIVPFEGARRGKIALEAKGQRLHLLARAFEGEDGEFHPGDEVVVVRSEGNLVEVVKPT